MDTDDWKARWREGSTRFHEGHVNAHLARHASVLDGKRRVLVPLCGKTEDMAFLASRGHEVVGVEVSELAVRAFFDEHDLVPSVTDVGGCRLFAVGPYLLVAGDVFDTTEAIVGPVDALYDRAALVALPEETRRRYARHLRALAPRLAAGLIVTFEYPQEQIAGPPFSVDGAELRALYADARVEELGSNDANDNPRFREAGVPATERCFALTFAPAAEGS